MLAICSRKAHRRPKALAQNRVLGKTVRGLEHPDRRYGARPWWGLRLDRAQEPWRAQRRIWMRFGERTDLAILAGSGAPCPEGQLLKAHRPVSSAGVQLPAAGLIPATALNSQNRRVSHDPSSASRSYVASRRCAIDCYSLDRQH